jgi:hypothetical protein
LHEWHRQVQLFVDEARESESSVSAGCFLPRGLPDARTVLTSSVRPGRDQRRDAPERRLLLREPPQLNGPNVMRQSEESCGGG